MQKSQFLLYINLRQVAYITHIMNSTCNYSDGIDMAVIDIDRYLKRSSDIDHIYSIIDKIC